MSNFPQRRRQWNRHRRPHSAATSIQPRAFADALSIVLFHNHPSGDPLPSEDDVTFTVKVQHAAQLLDIVVVDHLVLGRSRYVSMKHRGDF